MMRRAMLRPASRSPAEPLVIFDGAGAQVAVFVTVLISLDHPADGPALRRHGDLAICGSIEPLDHGHALGAIVGQSGQGEPRTLPIPPGTPASVNAAGDVADLFEHGSHRAIVVPDLRSPHRSVRRGRR